MKRRIGGSKGFTLVELLVVLIIVAILAAVGAPIYMQYVKSARAADPQTAIGAVYTAEKVYFQKYDEYSSNIDELGVKIDESTLKSWTFEIGASGNNLSFIQATSTDEMPGGAGKVITYDVKSGQFHGYGIDD